MLYFTEKYPVTEPRHDENLPERLVWPVLLHIHESLQRMLKGSRGEKLLASVQPCSHVAETTVNIFMAVA